MRHAARQSSTPLYFRSSSGSASVVDVGAALVLAAVDAMNRNIAVVGCAAE